MLGIKQFICERVATETMDNHEDEGHAKLWKQKEKNLHYRVQWMGPKAKSHLNLQTYRVDTYLPKAFKMDKVVRCIFDPALRKLWDRSLEKYQREELVPDTNSLLHFLLTEPERILNYNPINFVEKGFSFYHDDAFYHWSSSAYMPDERGKLEHSSRIPHAHNVNRGHVQYVVTIIERECVDKKHMGKLKISSIASFDVPQIPQVVVDSISKKQIKEFVEGLKKFYTKNHKNL